MNPDSSNERILNADDYAQSLLEDIAQAKQTIELETYIYNDDQFGNQVTDALIQAAKRGVHIKLLMDGVGTGSWFNGIQIMENVGVNIRIFHPVPWKPWQWQRSNYISPFFAKFFFTFSKINLRNHRKTCLIDNSIVYIGSINISQKHLSQQQGGENWSDTMVRLVGVDTNDLQVAFDIAWMGYSIEERIKRTFKRIQLNPLFRFNYSRRQRRVLYKSLLRRFRHAKHRVWLTSAYFNPDFFLLRSLTRAAKHGVDVKIILPSKSDIAIMPIVANTFYLQLLKANIKIYEYLPNILHAKILIIDDWFSVGSSNLNHRSLRHDLEIDVNIQTVQAKKMLEKQFQENINQSRHISFDDLKRQTVIQKMISRILLFFRYFL